MWTGADILKMSQLRPSLTCCHSRPTGQQDSWLVYCSCWAWAAGFTCCIWDQTLYRHNEISLCIEKPVQAIIVPWNFQYEIRLLPTWPKELGKKHLALNNGTIFKYPVRKMLVLFWILPTSPTFVQLFVRLSNGAYWKGYYLNIYLQK